MSNILFLFARARIETLTGARPPVPHRMPLHTRRDTHSKHHKRLSRLFPAEGEITEPRERGLTPPSRGIFCKIQCVSPRVDGERRRLLELEEASHS